MNENNSGLNNGVSENKETLNNNNREYILDDDECPLAILMNHPQTRGKLIAFSFYLLVYLNVHRFKSIYKTH